MCLCKKQHNCERERERERERENKVKNLVCKSNKVVHDHCHFFG